MRGRSGHGRVIDGGIAGVTTKALQTIDLSTLGDIDGTSFKLSGLLGGYATQNDNAVVSATFQDASGKPLSGAAKSSFMAKCEKGA